MCFSGGFALVTAVDPAVFTVVMSQPVLPAPIGHRGRAALGLDPNDRRQIEQRAQEGLCVLGLQFTIDRQSLPERFYTLRRTLGETFESIDRLVTGKSRRHPGERALGTDRRPR